MPLVRVPGKCSYKCVPGPPPGPGQRPDSVFCKTTCNLKMGGGSSTASELPEEEIVIRVPPGKTAEEVIAEYERSNTNTESNKMCMCNGNPTPELVCPRTANAIQVENSSQLVTFALGGVSTLSVNLNDIPLWRSIRMVYFATSLTNPNDAQMELVISGITQAGPFLGGELDSSNGNPCAIFNCASGRVAGPIETATLTVSSVSGAAFPVGTTVTVRIAYAYQGSAAFQEDLDACMSPKGACAPRGSGGAAVP